MLPYLEGRPIQPWELLVNSLRIASLVGLSFLSANALVAQPPNMVLPVSYTEAVNHEVRGTLELTGSVAAYRSSVVASSIAGVVIELRARDGRAVRRGDTLARMRPDTFELQLRGAGGAAGGGARETQAGRGAAAARPRPMG